MVRSRSDEMQSEDPLNAEWPNEAEQPSLSQILAQLEESHGPPDKMKDTSACSEAGSSETENPPAKRQLLSGKWTREALFHAEPSRPAAFCAEQKHCHQDVVK